MKVYILDSVPFNAKNARSLVNRITSDGEATDSIMADANGIAVKGMYFILGHPRDIAAVLQKAPETSFIGHSLVALFMLNREKKSHSVLMVTPEKKASLAQESGAWVTVNRNQAASNSIRFREIASGLRSAAAGGSDESSVDVDFDI